ncbi:MAG: hypothetical protein ABIQ86_09675 [Steroidobacteraceae bacterium]
MKRFMLALSLLGAPITVSAADDLRLSQLEREVRNLERIVQTQSQQIEQLRRQWPQPEDRQRRPSSPATGATNDAVWLDASKWLLIKPGMSELEVISLLGPPVSMRTEDGGRMLLYAMEIGSSGFLSGSVMLRERVVLKVQKPELR